MKGKSFEAGRIAVSKQGHDKGTWLIVLQQLDDRYVQVVDGDKRPLEKPKKKQAKHLQWKPYVDENVAEGKALQNSDIRKSIKAIVAQETGEVRAASQPFETKKEECALVQE